MSLAEINIISGVNDALHSLKMLLIVCLAVYIVIKLGKNEEKDIVVHVGDVEGILLADGDRSECLVHPSLHFLYFFIEKIVKYHRLSLIVLRSCDRQKPHSSQLLNPTLAILCSLRKSLLSFSYEIQLIGHPSYCLIQKLRREVVVSVLAFNPIKV